MSLAASAWRAASSALFPFARPLLRARHKTGFDERCGVYSPDKLEKLKKGLTLWIHAVSVGEVHAASPIVRVARASGWGGNVVLSTVTETGAQSAASLIGDAIGARIYAPWDVPGVVRRARAALNPSAYAVIETELWPNLLFELKREHVPSILVNARISDRTFKKSSGPLRGLMREGYGMYDLILARGDEDARRLRAIGVDMKKVLVNGDVKVDAIAEQRAACSKMLPGLASRVSLGGGPMFVAGSTHEGEDEALIRAFLGIKSSGVRGAMLAIAPRHPGRSRAVLEMAGRGGRAALFSELSGGESPPPEIVIIDTIGPLYGFYGIAACAFIGGSLVPKGGQNILEPASWGVPVLHGPFMEDFAAPTAELDALGASYRVNGHEDIEALWRKAMLGELPDPSVHCAEYFSRKSGAAARAWAHLERYL